MPKISKDTAPDVEDFGAAIDRGGQLDDYTVDFVTIRESHSLAPLLKGLPGDSCQCPHWGYMLAGKITVSYPDHDEVYQAGDAFYMTPGHVPAAEEGSEFIQFSPRQQLADTMAAIKANAQQMMAGGSAGLPARAAAPRLVICAATTARWASRVLSASSLVWPWPGPAAFRVIEVPDRDRTRSEA